MTDKRHIFVKSGRDNVILYGDPEEIAIWVSRTVKQFCEAASNEDLSITFCAPASEPFNLEEVGF